MTSETHSSRRNLLRTSAALGAAMMVPNVHAQGSGTIRIGLVGCGGRGTGAAVNAMNAGKDVKLVAMADIFQERLDLSLASLKKSKPDQVDVPPERRFLGFDAYKQVIPACDVVLLTAYSHFAPTMLKAAVDAGKHVFCEKPHAIDVPSLKIAMAACDEAKKKNLSVVSGLCWRYDPGVRETMKRVLDGQIGQIMAIQENYVTTPYVVRPRKPGQSEMEYQYWNWYYFNWLCGDQTAQQLIHSLDKASWALGDKPPLRAWGMGGRQVTHDPTYGDTFDHQAVVFDYENDVRVFGFTRKQLECFNNTSDLIIGTKGRCDVLKNTITGENPWKYAGPGGNMYDIEHKELFESIRNGKPINNGNYMCLSTAISIMAQAACYSGNMITWNRLMASTRSFAQPKYALDAEPPVKPRADGTYDSPLQGKAELARWVTP